MRNWRSKPDLELIWNNFFIFEYLSISDFWIKHKIKHNKDLQNLEFPSSKITVVPTKNINFLICSLEKFILIYCFFVLIKTVCRCWSVIFWFKWLGNFLLLKLLPWKFSKPWVLFELLDSWFRSKPIFRLSYNQLINKISCLRWPFWRNILLLDRVLFGDNCITDLIPVLTCIRSFSYHQLMGNNADSIEINWKWVNLLIQHLWGHITWCPTCIQHLFLT